MTILVVMDIFTADSPVGHFHKATWACRDSQPHEDSGTRTTKPVLDDVAGVLAKQRQGSGQVWANLANSQNSGTIISFDFDFLLTCPRIVESVNCPTKSCNKSLFSTESHKNVRKQSQLPTSDKHTVRTNTTKTTATTNSRKILKEKSKNEEK